MSTKLAFIIFGGLYRRPTCRCTIWLHSLGYFLAIVDITFWICFFLHSSHGGGQIPLRISGAIRFMVPPSSSHGPSPRTQSSCCRTKFSSCSLTSEATSTALHLTVCPRFLIPSKRPPLGGGRRGGGGGGRLGRKAGRGGRPPSSGGGGGGYAFLDKAGKYFGGGGGLLRGPGGGR